MPLSMGVTVLYGQMRQSRNEVCMMQERCLAREIVEGAVVLLRNEDDTLPLPLGTKLALFCRAQVDTILSGNGSGAVEADDARNILDACEAEGLVPVRPLADWYRALPKPVQESELDWTDIAAMSKLVHNGAIYEYFGQYRPTPPEAAVPTELLQQAAEQTDTALFVLGRCAGGEECDRHLEDDYYLSKAEEALLDAVCAAFDKVIVVLNVNGLIDLCWLERYPAIRSVLFLGIPGCSGPEALVRILTGEVCPSGRLPVTIPRRYEDIPCAADFSWDKAYPERILTYADYGLDAEANGSHGFAFSPVTVYREGVYNGYRYFSSFDVEPLFAFGYGLSYTSFLTNQPATRKTPSGFDITVKVTNTGSTAGREVVQLYVDTSGVAGDAPLRTLAAFAKTGLLRPGEITQVTLSLSWRELARYSEEQAAWIIAPGCYGLCLGQDACHVQPFAAVRAEDPLLVEQCSSLLSLRPCNADKLDLLQHSHAAEQSIAYDFTVTQADIPPSSLRPGTDDTAALSLSMEELASLCVGYGPGTPFSAFGDKDDPSTWIDASGRPLTVNDHPAGFPGYVSPAIPDKGIHSITYKDGPAGVGGIAWPSEMLIACSFDAELCRCFGAAVAKECRRMGVNVWLAPAVNLHRHPLCGRNFEYFSEDPLLTGRLACAVLQGLQENPGVLACPKHFAANEQETWRRGSARLQADAADSILTEHTLREMYLRPFEMLVREGGARFVMTSFNKINGVFAAGNADLCSRLLREEWGFDGLVVTDWGDMDTVADGADAVAAGNDIVMPGGPPVIRQICTGFQEGRVTRAQLEAAVSHLDKIQRSLRKV